MTEHNSGGDYSNERHTKLEINSEKTHRSMNGKKNRGLDYTPLFKFLLSKVGQDWTEIHSEALSRLDKEEPIYYLVAKNVEEKEEIVRLGESSFYSGLYIDENNKLQKVNPLADSYMVNVTCKCCTFSFNGAAIKMTDEQRETVKKKFF